MYSAILVPPLTLVSQIQCILFIISSYIWKCFPTGQSWLVSRSVREVFFSQNLFNRVNYYMKSESLGFKTDAVLEIPRILEGFLNLVFEF